jgi:hypothetical protein
LLAQAEAKRFLSALEEAIAREKSEGGAEEYKERSKTKYANLAPGTKEAGTLRRASLDLTRALAELRKF